MAQEKEDTDNVLVLMSEPETAIAIITGEGSRDASLCHFCSQYRATCCPCHTEEPIYKCDGYLYNQSPAKEVEAYIKRQPTA